MKGCTQWKSINSLLHTRTEWQHTLSSLAPNDWPQSTNGSYCHCIAGLDGERKEEKVCTEGLLWHCYKCPMRLPIPYEALPPQTEVLHVSNTYNENLVQQLDTSWGPDCEAGRVQIRLGHAASGHGYDNMCLEAGTFSCKFQCSTRTNTFTGFLLWNLSLLTK